MIAQVQNDARMRQGQVLTFLKGTGKPEEAMLAANDDVAALFREMIGDVERNYATQARVKYGGQCLKLLAMVIYLNCLIKIQKSRVFLEVRSDKAFDVSVFS
jgi:hypothetical protein